MKLKTLNSRELERMVRKEIKSFIVVADYNKIMGGVKLADWYRVLYGGNRNSRKWWHNTM